MTRRPTQKSGHPKIMFFLKIAIDRSREGLRCEPMGRYSEKSTLRGSVYLLIEVQEGPEVVFAETGGRNFENFAVQPAGWLAGRLAGQLAGRLASAGWPAGRRAGRPKLAE